LRFLVENHSTIGIALPLNAAGFAAIFIEANHLTGDWTNAGFYRENCHVMLQRVAADKRYSLAVT
jgi:hypothetical protein